MKKMEAPVKRKRDIDIFHDCDYGSHETVREYLFRGGDPNITLEGYTLLTYAVMNGDFDMCRILLSSGADPDYIDPFGRSYIDLIPNQNQELIQMFIDFGSNICHQQRTYFRIRT